VRRMRGMEHVACMGEMRNAYRLLVSKHERKKPLWRIVHRMEDNTKMDSGRTGWGNVYHIHVAQDCFKWHVLMDTVRNFQFHKIGAFSEEPSSCKLLRRTLVGGGVAICISKFYVYGIL
jgi:hypothetical protein